MSLTQGRRRTRLVFAFLLGATVVSLALASTGAPQLLGTRGVAVTAILVAAVKARYIAMDFMEVRGTSLRPWFEAWIAITATASVILMLR